MLCPDKIARAWLRNLRSVREPMRCPGMEAAEVMPRSGLHGHDAARLSLVLAGRIHDCGFVCDPGSVVFHPPGGACRIDAEDSSRVLQVLIPRDRFSAINTCLGGALARPLLLEEREAGVYRWRVVLEWRRSEPSPVLVEAAALALLSRAAAIVRAREVCAAREQLSARQAALQARLDAARQALLATSSGIADIAANTGFTDHAHLTKMFRKAFGMTPSDYRAVYR